MADIRVKNPLGQWRDTRSDNEGRLVTKEPTKSYRFGPTAVALSTATTLVADLGGRPAELVMVEAKFSSAPTTSENFTLTLTSHRGDTQFDVVVFSQDPSASAVTSLVQLWEIPYPLEPGDELTVAYTNTDTRTVAGRIVIRPVS